MTFPEFHYRWHWRLASSPEALWPLVTDTNRFNRDVGVPDVERRGVATGAPGRRLKLTRFGVAVEWEEEPFEWLRPSRFGVVRRYSSGPVAIMRVLVEIAPSSDGGSDLTYQVWAQPRNALGLAAIPAQIGLLSARAFDRTIRGYDRSLSGLLQRAPLPAHVRFAPGGRERLAALQASLAAEASYRDLVPRLVKTIEEEDDLALAHFRPYALADQWGAARRSVLELCLAATRAGLLQFRWRLMCPLCRGARESLSSLGELKTSAHCESCNIDFTANLDRSVELQFRPSPSIRETEDREFCVGGPQVTPHIVAQQVLAAGATRTLTVPLEPGRYRVRAINTPGGRLLEATPDGAPQTRVSARLDADGWPDGELVVSTRPELVLENATTDARVFALERLTWTDQAATAAEVTSLQVFRDLFATEALRPGEECSVGSLAIVFTDLRSSTELYREVGDAVAFGHVLNHFDVLKASIGPEGGGVVKTIGDAMMVVFTRPAPALRAMLQAQATLAAPPDGRRPLTLKVGLHYGPCIAVTLNDRLDYFGSTINIAARLEGQSSGSDIVISSAVHDDPEVAGLLDEHAGAVTAEPTEATLKGFDQERFHLWRVRRV